MSSSDRYTAGAIYYVDSDCVEYVREDSILIYDRVDPFLTLIYDSTGDTLVGFKLKGFRNLFSRLGISLSLSNDKFLQLTTALEAVITNLGNQLFADDAERQEAYRRAYTLASNENVRLSEAELTRLAA